MNGCAALKMENNGTHYTVPVDVGTPPQRFSLVADTGSNSLIIPSCACITTGYCEEDERCFRGTNKSSTFQLMTDPSHNPSFITVSFGSGAVEAVVARDVVQVGPVKAFLRGGILLMTGKALNIQTAFEGILGLGLPNAKRVKERGERNAMRADMYKNVAERRVGPVGFLEQTGINHFYICFGREGGGVLRMGQPEGDDALLNVGEEHWGLSFGGISVGRGGTAKPQGFCTELDMPSGQQAPCGIIPDSGTSAIMGPRAHIEMMMDGICDGWKRCRDNHTALVRAADAATAAAEKFYGRNPWPIKAQSRAQVLDTLLSDCHSFLDSSDSLHSEHLPPLLFHVRGRDGKEQALEIPATRYLRLVSVEDMEYTIMHTPFGDLPLRADRTGTFSKRCVPLFGAIDYKTKTHGDIWILGVPLFSQYRVGFDLKNPAMSFRSLSEVGGCTDCEAAPDGASSLLSVSEGLQWIKGPLRAPNIDVTSPF